MEQRDACLLFPPHCESGIKGPHLALPQLKAFLDSKNISCCTADLNLGFFRWKTQPYALKPVLDKLIVTGDAFADKPTISRPELDKVTLATEAKVLLNAITPYEGEATLPDALFNIAIGLLSNELYDVPRDFGDIVAAAEIGSPSLFSTHFESLDLDGITHDAPIIGISVAFHLQIFPALLLARHLHARKGDTCQIILGGSQISLMTERQIDALVSLPFISAIVLHEGEIPLAEIAAQGLAVDYSTIPNTVYLDGDTVRRTKWHTPPPMELLPTPEFNASELSLYPQPTLFPVYVSKGCYWGKCKFCDYTKLYTPGQAKTAGWSTFRQPEMLVDDMVSLQSQWGASLFYLVSEAITPSYYKRLARIIIDRRVHAQMSSYCRVEKGNSYEFFKLLYRAGVRSLTFGVEATNDRILELIDKGNTVEQIENTIRSASSAGIFVVFNVIPDYPTTTWEEAQQTIEFIENNIDFIGMVNPQFFNLSSNSSVKDELEEHGLAVVSSDPIRTNHGAHSISFQREKGLSTQQIAELHSIYNRLFGDVRCYRRSQNLSQLLTQENFKWESARFVFDENVHVINAPFDPTLGKEALNRLDGDWVLLMHRDFRRLVLAPGIMQSVFDLSSTQGPSSMSEIAAHIEDEWEINDRQALAALIKVCIMDCARHGLLRNVMHPKIPL